VVLAQNEAILRAFRTSIILGAADRVISTTLGVLASLALVRYRVPGRNLITTMLIAPILVPEVVLAVALLLFLNFLDSRQELHAAAGRACHLHPALRDSGGAGAPGRHQARCGGGGDEPRRLARCRPSFPITLPLLMPAVLAGGLFAFTISFDDITGTLFWKPGGD
jgi:spermidine/putrescine transport system permease protein